MYCMNFTRCLICTSSVFQVDPHAKPVKELEIYNMMIDLLNAEKKCMDKIHDSEDEVFTTDILNSIM